MHIDYIEAHVREDNFQSYFQKDEIELIHFNLRSIS